MEILETTQTVIYNRLCLALQAASTEEERIRNFPNEHSSNPDNAHLKKLESITSAELPECLGKIIGALDLHGPFQSLGRYVRSFSDAEFVVRCLREPILSNMGKAGISGSFEPFDKLIECCDKTKNIVE